MCLAIPLKILKKENDFFALELMGKEAGRAKSLLEVEIGDYVIVQNNLIIEKVEEEKAQEMYKIMLREEI